MSFDAHTVRLLEEIRARLERIEKLLNKIERNRVTGGVIHRIPTKDETHMGTSAFPPLGPGITAKFQVTPEPAGVVTVAANAVWSSSDSANFPVVTDTSDPTGNTADVTIPTTETATETVTLTWTYTNADGTTATASAQFDLVGGTVAPVDVTGGTIARIA